MYGIVKQSGGYIDASNEPNGGAAFRLCLPCVGGAPNAAPFLPAMPGSLSGRETILLVADDVQVRAFAREALTRYGYSVLDAADIDSAMALAEAARVRSTSSSPTWCCRGAAAESWPPR